MLRVVIGDEPKKKTRWKLPSGKRIYSVSFFHIVSELTKNLTKDGKVKKRCHHFEANNWPCARLQWHTYCVFPFESNFLLECKPTKCLKCFFHFPFLADKKLTGNFPRCRKSYFFTYNWVPFVFSSIVTHFDNWVIESWKESKLLGCYFLEIVSPFFFFFFVCCQIVVLWRNYTCTEISLDAQDINLRWTVRIKIITTWTWPEL